MVDEDESDEVLMAACAACAAFVSRLSFVTAERADVSRTTARCRPTRLPKPPFSKDG